LKRAGKDVYYFKSNKGAECDFVVKERNKITAAFQACLKLDEDNLERETRGLLEALKEFGLSEGLILSGGEEDAFELQGKKIVVKPAWKWSLETTKLAQTP
jgi:predicted AAA+ superfamily ATPase